MWTSISQLLFDSSCSGTAHTPFVTRYLLVNGDWSQESTEGFVATKRHCLFIGYDGHQLCLFTTMLDEQHTA